MRFYPEIINLTFKYSDLQFAQDFLDRTPNRNVFMMSAAGPLLTPLRAIGPAVSGPTAAGSAPVTRSAQRQALPACKTLLMAKRVAPSIMQVQTQYLPQPRACIHSRTATHMPLSHRLVGVIDRPAVINTYSYWEWISADESLFVLCVSLCAYVCWWTGYGVIRLREW